MVEDLNLTLSIIDNLITHAAEGMRWHFPERAGMYAAIGNLCADLREHIERNHNGDGYALEKVGKIGWHTRAMLGFDIDNGHDIRQHHVWALGSMDSLKSVLKVDRFSPME